MGGPSVWSLRDYLAQIDPARWLVFSSYPTLKTQTKPSEGGQFVSDMGRQSEHGFLPFEGMQKGKSRKEGPTAHGHVRDRTTTR